MNEVRGMNKGRVKLENFGCGGTCGAVHDKSLSKGGNTSMLWRCHLPHFIDMSVMILTMIEGVSYEGLVVRESFRNYYHVACHSDMFLHDTELVCGEYWSGSRLDTAYWGFLGVGTMFDIFQNIILIPYLEYGVLSPLDMAY
ncbi:hypothetical protein Tco_0795502 [Tanacetum coccineum]